MTIQQLYRIYESHPEVTTDSRKTPPGSIFFALKGENSDGNTYAAKALDGGCAFAVVDDPAVVADDRYILVDNVLSAMQQLASYHRIAWGRPVIGVTGTNGKTTTKELLSAVLSRRFNLWHTQGNFNNHIGVPLTLLSIRPEHELAIVEMGANHPGEIKTLVNIVSPNAGLITNVGKAHLQGFGSFEGVVRTKCELYDFLRSTGGQVFVNLDNPILSQKSEGITTVGYGLEHREGLVYGEVTGNSPFLSLRFYMQDGSSWDVQTNLIGAYNAENVMASVCVGVFFGVPAADIRDALQAYVPTNNRSQFTQTGNNRLIIDAYNANPTSMTASIRNFAEVSMEKKTLILGEMRELGDDSNVEHQNIINLCLEKGLTDVYLVGDCFESVSTDFPRFKDVYELIRYVRQHPFSDRSILIKGSNGNHLDRIVQWL
ncbi:MAG: UDP-N-acetylmuramoyl-tripeptide--D-alanyl-D-alanine ligase [Paludibacteraceae bacterium]|nr:UDP-N-acetylmuramoyl-tripeptide--D-alanyl-D-alanine ligase [Paludibacteraceae bacterium]